MLRGAQLIAALRKIATISMNSTLVRNVPLFALIGNQPLQFLYTSGKPNRFNLSRTNRLYLSKDERTAREERRRLLAGLPNQHAPYVTFFAKVRLRKVLDLEDLNIRRILRLSDAELFADWRTAGTPVDTQTLGEAVAYDTRITAIRYSSVAARESGFPGTNAVIFRDKIVNPDSVEVFGDNGKIVERLPSVI